VINGLSDLLHRARPSRVLHAPRAAGSLEGLKIAYVGDGNNVSMS